MKETNKNVKDEEKGLLSESDAASETEFIVYNDDLVSRLYMSLCVSGITSRK